MSSLGMIKNRLKDGYRDLRFHLGGSNNLILQTYYKYVYQPKKGSLEEFLDCYSKINSDFFVIQIGANDGMTHDPIHKFIKRDQWSGVLLEPQKNVFEKYLKPLYRKDGGIETINAALGHEAGTQEIFRIAFSNARWATGLTSFRKSVLEKAFEIGHVQRRAAKQGIKVPDSWDERIVADIIPVLTLNQLYKKFNIQEVSLLQIDTEGFDFEIIKMFDLAHKAPRVISYENHHLSPADSSACKDLLVQAGYSVKDYKGNTLAMKQPPERLKRFFI